MDVFLILGDRQGNTPDQTTSIMLYAASIGFQLCLCTPEASLLTYFSMQNNTGEHILCFLFESSFLCWSCCFILVCSFIILGLFWEVSPFAVEVVGPKAAPFKDPKRSGSATPTTKGILLIQTTFRTWIFPSFISFNLQHQNGALERKKTILGREF